MSDQLRLVVNRPGLTAIAYRIAGHPRFKRDLLAAIAREPALRGLTTRGDDDFAIALLDAWATAADVVTFYQERIANESYLRTASERLSLEHLARLLGYELGPGVAAGVALAFTVDPVSSRGQPVAVPVGTKVQSIPGPGEPPQTFETSLPLDARAVYNELRPTRAGGPPTLALTTDVTIQQVATGRVLRLLPNESLDNTGIFAVVRENLALERWTLRDAGDGRVFIESAVGSLLTFRPDGPDGPLVVGHPRRSPPDDAQRWLVEPAGAGAVTIRNQQTGGLLEVAADKLFVRVTPASGAPTQRWLLPASAARARLLVREAVAPGDLVLADRPEPGVAVVEVVTPRPDLGGHELQLGRFSGAPPLASARFSVFRQRAALFGHNAPDARTLGGLRPALHAGGNLDSDWADFGVREDELDLDAVHPINVGETAVLRDGDSVRVFPVARAEPRTRANFSLSARVTRLSPGPATGAPLSAFDRRRTTVFLAPAPLTLLAEPRTDPVEGRVLELATPVPDLEPGRLLLVSGVGIDGDVVSELATLESLADGGARLTLASDLRHRYRRDATIVRANLVAATHGETVVEVLGGGDASAAFQRFALRQPPLTFLSARNARGRVSTLEVVVDGVRWREVDTLEAAGPDDRVYTLQLGQDGAAAVQFGDGVRGARLPTGTANVRAAYRRGLGLAGHVPAGRLALLATPVTGVLAVTNPFPAAGAAPPEDLADARDHAPLPVRTLGRVVSVQDYADFARAFTGVAKAHAVGFRDRDRHGVLVTIAGFGGAELLPDNPTHQHLLAALRDAGEPSVLVRLQSYTPVRFRPRGVVTIAPERELAPVRAALRAALLARFGFAARDFARPVYPSEVIAALQAVPGVLAVDLEAPVAPLRAAVAPRPATPQDPRRTELLTIDLDPADPADPIGLGDLEVRT